MAAQSGDMTLKRGRTQRSCCNGNNDDIGSCRNGSQESRFAKLFAYVETLYNSILINTTKIMVIILRVTLMKYS